MAIQFIGDAMKKKIVILLVAFIALGVFVSCTTTKQETKKESDVYKQSLADDKGNKLDLCFNNADETVKINFNGTEAVLKRQVSASGYIYANDEYELMGKVNDVYLRKNAKLIFVHEEIKEQESSEN